MSLKSKIKKVAKKAKAVVKKISKPLAIVVGVGIVGAIVNSVAHAKAKQQKLSAIARTAASYDTAPEVLPATQTTDGSEITNENIVTTKVVDSDGKVISDKKFPMIYIIIGIILVGFFFMFGRKKQ